MLDKNVSLAFVIAYLGWVAAFAIVIIDLCIGSDALGELGILVGAAAATGTVRLWQLGCTERIENTMVIVRDSEDWARVRPLR